MHEQEGEVLTRRSKKEYVKHVRYEKLETVGGEGRGLGNGGKGMDERRGEEIGGGERRREEVRRREGRKGKGEEG